MDRSCSTLKSLRKFLPLFTCTHINVKAKNAGKSQ